MESERINDKTQPEYWLADVEYIYRSYYYREEHAAAVKELERLRAAERKLQAVRESLVYCTQERSELIATDFDQSKGMEVVIEEIERALGTP